MGPKGIASPRRNVLIVGVLGFSLAVLAFWAFRTSDVPARQAGPNRIKPIPDLAGQGGSTGTSGLTAQSSHEGPPQIATEPKPSTQADLAGDIALLSHCGLSEEEISHLRSQWELMSALKECAGGSLFDDCYSSTMAAIESVEKRLLSQHTGSLAGVVPALDALSRLRHQLVLLKIAGFADQGPGSDDSPVRSILAASPLTGDPEHDELILAEIERASENRTQDNTTLAGASLEELRDLLRSAQNSSKRHAILQAIASRRWETGDLPFLYRWASSEMPIAELEAVLTGLAKFGGAETNDLMFQALRQADSLPERAVAMNGIALRQQLIARGSLSAPKLTSLQVDELAASLRSESEPILQHLLLRALYLGGHSAESDSALNAIAVDPDAHFVEQLIVRDRPDPANPRDRNLLVRLAETYPEAAVRLTAGNAMIGRVEVPGTLEWVLSRLEAESSAEVQGGLALGLAQQAGLASDARVVRALEQLRQTARDRIAKGDAGAADLTNLVRSCDKALDLMKQYSDDHEQ